MTRDGEREPLNGGTTTYRYRRQKSMWSTCGALIFPTLLVLVFLAMMIGGAVVIFSFSSRGRSRVAANELNLKLNSGHTGASVPIGCEVTILIFRHCEKFGEVIDAKKNQHCSYIGMERAEFIASLFGSDSDKVSRWPFPSYMYAFSAGRPHSKHLNFREIETILPLANKMGDSIKIDAHFGAGDNEHLAKHILDAIKSGEMCGKLSVVSWRHSDIAPLATHMGCGPSTGCPMSYKDNDFDSAWQLKYVYNDPTPSSDLSRFQTGVVEPAPKKKSHRFLKHSKDHPRIEASVEVGSAYWSVYGTVLHEEFDPLAFSKNQNGEN
eukprot:scaffold126028_cov46-Attheya_sp.AAC.1